MEQKLFSRGAFSSQGQIKVFSSFYGDTIEVDPTTFVRTVHKLQALVDSATTPARRLAVRVLQDMCLSHRNSGKRHVYQRDIAEVLSGFIIHDGYTMALSVKDSAECRIILDTLVCPDFMSVPRLNPTILSRVDAMSPQHAELSVLVGGAPKLSEVPRSPELATTSAI